MCVCPLVLLARNEFIRLKQKLVVSRRSGQRSSRKTKQNKYNKREERYTDYDNAELLWITLWIELAVHDC